MTWEIKENKNKSRVKSIMRYKIIDENKNIKKEQYKNVCWHYHFQVEDLW